MGDLNGKVGTGLENGMMGAFCVPNENDK